MSHALAEAAKSRLLLAEATTHSSADNETRAIQFISGQDFGQYNEEHAIGDRLYSGQQLVDEARSILKDMGITPLQDNFFDASDQGTKTPDESAVFVFELKSADYDAMREQLRGRAKGAASTAA